MLHLENTALTRKLLSEDFENWPKERLESRIRQHAKTKPNKIAVKDPWRTLTYAQLDKEIDFLAATMKRDGIGKNSVILIQLPNIVEAMIVFHATLRIGAVVLPVTPIYREAEMRAIFKQIQPELIFIPNYFKNNDYTEMYESLKPYINGKIIGVNVLEEPAAKYEVQKWEDYIDRHAEPVEELSYDPFEYCMLMFTSGTTSSPKGVLHTHGTLGVAISTFDGIETTDSDGVFLVASPVTHITGVVVGILGPMKIGGTSILVPKWDVKEGVRIIREDKCTYTMASTPFLSQIINECEEKKLDLPSMKYFACGGADVSEYQLRKAKSVIPTCTFSRIYGSTEAPGISKFRKGYSEEKRYSHDGRPSAPCRVRTVPGSELPNGSAEIQVYGPQLFLRYLNWSESENVMDEEWFSTGDLATIDEDGFIQIAGRDKDIIIRGGENYSAKEIEDILIEIPKIKEIAIVGFKDPDMGERACAFVTLKKSDETITLQELIDLLDEKRIAKQKWPERLEVVNVLPYTHSGKLQKYLLRESLNKVVSEK